MRMRVSNYILNMNEALHLYVANTSNMVLLPDHCNYLCDCHFLLGLLGNNPGKWETLVQIPDLK